MVKELEKRQQKAKREFDVFKAARERAARGFFGLMRPRLKKQNAVKYVDRERETEKVERLILQQEA